MPLSRPKIWTAQHGFTLAEIIVTIILIGMLAGLALTKYHESLSTHIETQGATYLKMIHTANVINKSKTGNYWTTNQQASRPQINAGLGMKIPDDSEYTYKYISYKGGSEYKATAIPTGYSFKLQIDQNTLSNSNPCCSHGSCPALPNC